MGFSDLPTFGISVFQILEIGFFFKDRKIKGGSKLFYQAELSFGTPKGVITARKKSDSTIRIVFSLFFGFWDFGIFRFQDFLDFKFFRKCDQPLLEEFE